MNDEPFKCGCVAGYREVVTGDLKAYAASQGGVGLEIAMDPCGTMYLSCDRDETWARAHLRKHLVVTITQFPNQGPKVVDIGVLAGRDSCMARKAARVGAMMGIEIKKVGNGQWHAHIPKGSIPDGHPILEEFGDLKMISMTDDQVDALDGKLQQFKRDHRTTER
jgi:hypothetical protein